MATHTVNLFRSFDSSGPFDAVLELRWLHCCMGSPRKDTPWRDFVVEDRPYDGSGGNHSCGCLAWLMIFAGRGLPVSVTVLICSKPFGRDLAEVCHLASLSFVTKDIFSWNRDSAVELKSVLCDCWRVRRSRDRPLWSGSSERPSCG